MKVFEKVIQYTREQLAGAPLTAALAGHYHYLYGYKFVGIFNLDEYKASEQAYHDHLVAIGAINANYGAFRAAVKAAHESINHAPGWADDSFRKLGRDD